MEAAFSVFKGLLFYSYLLTNKKNMMKKMYLFVLGANLVLAACVKQEDTPSMAVAANVRSAPFVTENLAPGVVPSDIGLFDMTLEPEKHTWRDLDDFYKNVVLKKSEESYFSDLRKMTIWHLVEQFGLLEKADIMTIDYYIHEQRKLDLVDGAVFAQCLERLKAEGEVMNEMVKFLGNEQYEKSKAYALANFTPEFWEKHGPEFEKIKVIAASVPDRWGQY